MSIAYVGAYFTWRTKPTLLLGVEPLEECILCIAEEKDYVSWKKMTFKAPTW